MQYNSDSSIKRYKLELVVQRFYQLHRINYMKTFIISIKYKSLRIFLVIAIILNMIFVQMDNIMILLKSIISQNNKPIYMSIFQRYLASREKLVCKI